MRWRDFMAGVAGTAAAWPFTLRAQQSVLPVIGFMSARSPEDSVNLLEAFYRGLKEGGYVDAESVRLERRWARGDYGELPGLARELVEQHVSVLVATGGDASARAAKSATSETPIAFTISGDPVEAGLVPSDLPVTQPTKYDLVINLKTARALDLKVPEALLVGADEVIE